MTGQGAVALYILSGISEMDANQSQNSLEKTAQADVPFRTIRKSVKCDENAAPQGAAFVYDEKSVDSRHRCLFSTIVEE